MKNTLAILLFTLSIACFSQSNNKIRSNQEIKFESLKMKLTITSGEDIESLDLDEIESIFEDSKPDESIQIEVVCKDNSPKNSKNQMMSYKINGNSNDLGDFMKNVKKMKRAIKKYYKNRA